MKESLFVLLVAGRFRLGTVDRDILKVQVQIHDATVICVHAHPSHESSSSQQPIWKLPDPPRPSKRMCVIWLLWRLIVKYMHSGPKGGSFILKHGKLATSQTFFGVFVKHGQVSILLKYPPSGCLEHSRTQIYSRH